MQQLFGITKESVSPEVHKEGFDGCDVADDMLLTVHLRRLQRARQGDDHEKGLRLFHIYKRVQQQQKVRLGKASGLRAADEWAQAAATAAL